MTLSLILDGCIIKGYSNIVEKSYDIVLDVDTMPIIYTGLTKYINGEFIQPSDEELKKIETERQRKINIFQQISILKDEQTKTLEIPALYSFGEVTAEELEATRVRRIEIAAEIKELEKQLNPEPTVEYFIQLSTDGGETFTQRFLTQNFEEKMTWEKARLSEVLVDGMNINNENGKVYLGNMPISYNGIEVNANDTIMIGGEYVTI